MAEARCSVCGAATSHSESCSFTLAPSEGGDFSASTHIVCSACSSRLSEEIAKGRTTILRPAGSDSVEGKEAKGTAILAEKLDASSRIDPLAFDSKMLPKSD